MSEALTDMLVKALTSFCSNIKKPLNTVQTAQIPGTGCKHSKGLYIIHGLNIPTNTFVLQHTMGSEISSPQMNSTFAPHKVPFSFCLFPQPEDKNPVLPLPVLNVKS